MVRKISVVIGKILFGINKIVERCKSQYILQCIQNSGDCHIGASCVITHPQNIVLGKNVWIGDNCLFMCAKAKIIMGNHIMLAPNVSIVTGDHRIDKVGEYMDSVTEKKKENDIDVVIEDDVWIGMNVTILKGVTIGRGSVIGAGSIIVKDVAPYSICFPDATRRKKQRFTDEEIVCHEKIIELNR